MKPVQHTDTVLLYNKLCSLRQSVLEQGSRLYHAWQPHIERSRFLYSAWNLALYLALRCHDLRPLQKQVLPLELSSLGRGEARTNTKKRPRCGRLALRKKYLKNWNHNCPPLKGEGDQPNGWWWGSTSDMRFTPGVRPPTRKRVPSPFQGDTTSIFTLLF